MAELKTMSDFKLCPTVIKTLPLFSELNAQETDIILRSSHLRRCEKGSFLYLHGDKVTHFYILCRGIMQIFRETPDGHEITSEILITGDTLCADEIIQAKRNHQSHARAVEDCVLLEISLSWMKEHLKDFDHLAARLLAGLSDRLYQAQLEAEHRATMSAPQMVACFLQRLCVMYDFDSKGFDLPVSKTLIASRLRMELETFSRTLKKLKEYGIEVEGTRVTFTDVHAAGEYVCNECSINEDCPTHQLLHDCGRQSEPEFAAGKRPMF
jgi:CRP-like cAMP-binding protein